MKITIITHGIPNTQSEQANNDPILFFNNLKENQIKFDLICIWDHILNTSAKSKKFQIKFIKKKYKNLDNFTVINFKLNLKERFLRFFFRMFSSKSYYFYGNKKIHDQVTNLVKKSNSKFVLNFFEFPASIFVSKIKNLKVFNYLGVIRKISEIQRLKNLILKKKISILPYIINSLVYILRIDKVYDSFLSAADLNFCAPKDTYNKFKKKHKNMYFSGALSNDYISLKKKETIIPTVLMIGNLRSTFMQDSINLIANQTAELNKIYKKKKFKLRIVGKFRPSAENMKKLKYPWVDLAGWVESSREEYARASYLFAPNSIALGPRTKMLEAASAKVCIITTKENVIKCFPKFKNGQDMMVANKMRNFSKYFEKVLLNEKLKNKMINSAQEKYIKYYSARLAIKRNINIMKKISNV